ncbi:MAG: chemotaxis protein CheW [Burkholderiaceae bacterium]|nr:chemotaxis protein CheW [Burkholderiaceae bacterium]
MSSEAQTVLEMRREFDAAFARAPLTETARLENLLAIRLGGDGYLLRVNQIAGLHADKAISPLPSPVAELRGLAGFRGRTAPVYDLAALLGYPAADKVRWLVLARAPEPLALAFEAFEAHFSTSATEVVRAAGATLKVAAALRPQIFDAVRFAGAMRPIVDLESIVHTIRRRCSAPAQPGSTPT